MTSPYGAAAASDDRLGPVEIACDESGYEGEKLTGGSTGSFAHASVSVAFGEASDCVAELRRRIRSPATEYKANHLLRQKHRQVLKWLLGAAGPIIGKGQVCLVDKERFLLEQVLAVLVSGASATTDRRLRPDEACVACARTLMEHRLSVPPARWAAFLVAANELLRVKERVDTESSMRTFFDIVSWLRRHADSRAGQVFDLLASGRERALMHRARMPAPPTVAVLDPLLPSIALAVRYWGGATRPVSLVHDRQNALSADRIAALRAGFAKTPGAGESVLRSVQLVESESSPPVQLADILAGTVRQIATDAADGNGDRELVDLLPPYVADGSVWEFVSPARG